MATKTAAKQAMLNRDDVTDQLGHAQAALDTVRRRIGEGEHVSAGELAEAEHAVEFARLRLEAVDEHERRSVEQARLQRIDSIRTSLTDGQLAKQAQHLIELAEEAQAALDRLYEEAEAHNAEVRSAFLELLTLRPVPDGIEGLVPKAGGGPPNSIVIDGTRVHLIADLPVFLIADAAYQIAQRHAAGQRVVSDLRRHAGHAGLPGNAVGQMSITERLAYQIRKGHP